MADTKISAMTAASSLTGAELIPLAQSGTNKSSTVDLLSGYTLGNSFVKFTGPTTSQKTFTLPNSNATLLYDGITGATLVTPVINGLSTGTGVASAATASTLASRDSNANLSANNFLNGYTTTATAAATTTLTVGSTGLQIFTGSTTQNVILPVTSTLALGHPFVIINNSSGTVTVKSSGSNTIQDMAGNTIMVVNCILTSGTTAASWSKTYWAPNPMTAVGDLIQGGTTDANGVATLSRLAPGTAGQVLTSNGAGVALGWTTVAGTSASLTAGRVALSTGSGTIADDSNLNFDYSSTKDLAIGSTSFNARLYVVQSALSASWVPVLRLDPGAHTSMTASTAFNGSFLKVSAATQTWATGSLTSQAFNYFDIPTIAFAGASTVSDVWNVFIKAPATNGANATVTRAWAIGTDGNFQVQGRTYLGAATTAATALLHIAAGTATANTAPLKFTAPAALLTTPEALVIEPAVNGDYLNLTTTTGTVRRVIVAGSAGRATAQTALNNSVATYTLGATDASYEISANVLVTTSSAENFTVTATYTDEGNTSRTVTLNFQILAGTIGTAINFANGAVPYEGIPLHIRCKASTSITIKTTGTFTGCTYNVEGVIKQTN